MHRCLSPIVRERAGLNEKDLFRAPVRGRLRRFGSLSEAAPSDKDQTDISDNPLSRGRESREKKREEKRKERKERGTGIKRRAR